MLSTATQCFLIVAITLLHVFINVHFHWARHVPLGHELYLRLFQWLAFALVKMLCAFKNTIFLVVFCITVFCLLTVFVLLGSRSSPSFPTCVCARVLLFPLLFWRCDLCALLSCFILICCSSFTGAPVAIVRAFKSLKFGTGRGRATPMPYHKSLEPWYYMRSNVLMRSHAPLGVC